MTAAAALIRPSRGALSWLAPALRATAPVAAVMVGRYVLYIRSFAAEATTTSKVSSLCPIAWVERIALDADYEKGVHFCAAQREGTEAASARSPGPRIYFRPRRPRWRRGRRSVSAPPHPPLIGH